MRYFTSILHLHRQNDTMVAFASASALDAVQTMVYNKPTLRCNSKCNNLELILDLLFLSNIFVLSYIIFPKMMYLFLAFTILLLL